MDSVEPDLIQNSVQSSLKEDDFGPNLICTVYSLTKCVTERPTWTVRCSRMRDAIASKCPKYRTRNSSRSDFIFYADRLIRLVVEEGLNQLPYHKYIVDTPTGCQYEGLRYEEGNCGVSIMRSGEAMEQGLRDCCRSIRIGKILVIKDEETQDAKVFYAKFPPDIHLRKVLLMYPTLCTGSSVLRSLEVLLQNFVQEERITILTLFASPNGIRSILGKFPKVKILTSEVHPIPPTHFGQKYFGTD